MRQLSTIELLRKLLNRQLFYNVDVQSYIHEDNEFNISASRYIKSENCKDENAIEVVYVYSKINDEMMHALEEYNNDEINFIKRVRILKEKLSDLKDKIDAM